MRSLIYLTALGGMLCAAAVAYPAPSAIVGSYRVVAPVVYRTTFRSPLACQTIFTSLPPAGCSGVLVKGYDFGRVNGLVRFGRMGWQTPVLRLDGTWDGRALTVTSATRVPASQETTPEPPAACHRGSKRPAVAVLQRRIARQSGRINLLEIQPCRASVWVLIAVADRASVSYIRRRFGNRVMVSGWLEPVT